MYEYAAKLVSIHDGDTLRADVDVGFSVTIRMDLRLLGLDCPELKTEAGKAALAWVKDYFAARGDFIIRTVKDKSRWVDLEY